MHAVVVEIVEADSESSLDVARLPLQDQLKRCTNCGVLKVLESFSKNRCRADGLDLHCRQCTRQRIRSKKARQLAQGLCTSCGSPRGDSRSRWCCQKCLTRDSGTRRSREMRAAVIHAYGGESPGCACCGETLAAFLTLDHVNNGGRAHRREKGNQGVYHELRRAGYAPGFQILCFNCNLARGWYRSCPHSTKGDSGGGASMVANPATTGSRICTRCKQGLAESEMCTASVAANARKNSWRLITSTAQIHATLPGAAAVIASTPG
jgi:hypothetical protein